jgi:hypothetical protein
MKEFLLNLAVGGCILGVLMLATECDKDHSSRKEGTRLHQVEQLAKSIAPHPSFREVASYRTNKSHVASVSKHYASSATYDEVKQFYSHHLKAQGWEIIEERFLPRNRFREAVKIIVFKKQDTEIDLNYREPGQGWDFAVGFTWKQ